jgi:hemerythrin-like metal-binding protein/PAS domain S-box-containing protein
LESAVIFVGKRKMFKGRGMFRSLVCSLRSLLAVALVIWPVTVSSREEAKPVLFLGNHNIPPMIFVQNGKPTGLVVDLARAIAERAGLKAEIRAMDWSQAQQMLPEGKGDALLQINSNPDREKILDFSAPLLESHFCIFRKYSRPDIQGVDSLSGLRVGVEKKGFPFLLLQRYPEIEVRVVPSWRVGFEMINAGEIDAVVVDRWVGEYELYVHGIQGISVVDEPIVIDYSAIAVQKGNRGLLNKINHGLRSIEEDGTRRAILDKWRSKEVVYVSKERLTLLRAFIGVSALAVILVLILLVNIRRTRVANRALAERSQELVVEVRERRQFQASIVRSEARLSAIFDNAPIGMALVGADRSPLMVNRFLVDFLGRSAAELAEMRFEEFTHPEDREKDVHLFAELVRGERERYSLSKRYLRPDGSVVYGDLLVALVPSAEGESAMSLAMVEDVTEQKQLEEDRELLRNRLAHARKMETVGQLTGGIAHDFNNLLAIILGNLELLEQRLAKDAKALSYLKSADKAAERGAELTRQLLGFSRREAAQVRACDVNEIIVSMQDLIARVLTPQVTIERVLGEKGWPVEIDSGDFQDALLNLATNASDAMPKGGCLTIETSNKVLDSHYCGLHPGSTPGEYVRLNVSDTGIGIEAERLDHIFEPFFTTKEQGKGTGLGLATVYGFCQRSGGHVTVYSTPGVGTTFSIYLPRSQAAVQGPGIPDGGEPGSLPPGGHESILIVDDEPQLLELAAANLQSLGYRVLTASDGSEAWAILNADPGIDLLFTDMVMPGAISGMELARQATDRFPALKVLLTSGCSGKMEAEGAPAFFVTNKLDKPYSKTELAQRIRKVLDASSVQAAEAPVDGCPFVNMELGWNESFSIGMPEMDADHLRLLELYNDILGSVTGAEEAAALDAALNNLMQYAQEHFQREEAIMAACAYPGLENHRQVHALLLEELEQMDRKRKQGELHLTEMVALIRNWWLDHTQGMDCAYVPHCKGKQALIEQALRKASTPVDP